MNKFNFLGLDFHNYSMPQAISQLEEFIKERRPRMVFTPTAELIVRANENSYLKQVYNTTDLLTIDSHVVYYAARLLHKPVREPVSAVRLMFNFLEAANRNQYRLYLLGAKEEVVNKTAQIIKEKYPEIKVVGWNNGYFDFNKPEKIIEEINSKAPDALFVAMSSPLKEEFISKNIKHLNVPVNMGVGGSFDILAGKCQLAPEWISKIGLEWFYRLTQEPKRLWKRYLITNTRFLILFIKEIFKRKVK